MALSKIKRREMDFLNAETVVWVDEGIISDEQSAKILSLYDVKASNLRAIMLTAGGILLGLGAVSFVMAHWHELDKFFRMCLIAGVYAASLCAYFLTGRSTKTGRAFLLLASGIFGAGIYLITHMYDYYMTFGEILGWWIGEVIITSVLARDEWQMYLAQFLSLIWMNEADAVNAFALYFVRTARIPIAEFFAPVRAFALMLSLWLAWFATRDRTAFTLNMLLTVLLMASRMSLCLGGTEALIILTVTGAVMSFMSKWRDTAVMGMLMLGVFGLLLTWPDFWRGEIFASGRNVYPVINAVIVAALMLLNIYRGHYGIGITFCALLASRYFFDHLFGYLPKAWGFTLTGVIFVTAGIFFGKIKKFFER